MVLSDFPQFIRKNYDVHELRVVKMDWDAGESPVMLSSRAGASKPPLAIWKSPFLVKDPQGKGVRTDRDGFAGAETRETDADPWRRVVFCGA